MDYRSNRTTSADQADSSSSPSTSHGPSSSSYYNNLLDPNHRSTDLGFYNTDSNNRDTMKLETSTASSSSSNTNGHSLLDSQGSMMDNKGATLQAPTSSAFHTLDGSTSFHHPQPLYMETRDDYQSTHNHSLYLDDPSKGNHNDMNNNMMPYPDRRDTLSRNGLVQRHHPYAKLSNDSTWSALKKHTSSSRLGSRPLTKEIDDLSVKTESDHRPW
ncbi:hypothetical protein BC941DRAFT_428470 [Chlamydoabsidia padenii]|nr:hypothetical protein BC941DRAFT_428470 [Chlamydoabsidia padenii]